MPGLSAGPRISSVAAILMLHGLSDTGDMWQPLAVAMMLKNPAAAALLGRLPITSAPAIN